MGETLVVGIIGHYFYCVVQYFNSGFLIAMGTAIVGL